MREDVLLDLNVGGGSRFCKDCPSLCENYWVEDSSFHTIHIIDEGLCNLDCLYCVRSCKAGKITQKTHPNHSKLLRALEQRKLIDKSNLTIDISCDELTVLPYCDEIIDGILPYAPFSTIMLFSNATVFSQKIADIMTMNKHSYMICSMDCGTRKTFQAIKKRDLFDAAVNNLIEYARKGVNIELKYIVLPGINDNLEEASAFMGLCEKVQPIGINISREIESCVKDKIDLPNEAVELIRWFLAKPNVKLGWPYTDNDVKRIFA
jgi:wyosine [tRNA(Phe)-imidazoG37] synthetase (radical SAM superfamily)